MHSIEEQDYVGPVAICTADCVPVISGDLYVLYSGDIYSPHTEAVICNFGSDEIYIPWSQMTDVFKAKVLDHFNELTHRASDAALERLQEAVSNLRREL